jgi:putative holliday junction resolvase
LQFLHLEFVRILAIDPGARRVGLAMSDEGGKFATPLSVVEISSPANAIDQIVAVASRESVQQLLVGLPLNMDDTTGPAARQTIAWAKALAKRANLPLIFVDERLSSFAAEQAMIDRKRGGEKITRKQKKARLDAHAAATFLQAFLDGKLPAIDVS